MHSILCKEKYGKSLHMSKKLMLQHERSLHNYACTPDTINKNQCRSYDKLPVSKRIIIIYHDQAAMTQC